MRSKLLNFLMDSKHYVPGYLLGLYNSIIEQGLHEERALLLARIGNHVEALKEYVHKLQDFEMAEKYCQQHYDPESEEGRGVYLDLLKARAAVTTHLNSAHM